MDDAGQPPDGIPLPLRHLKANIKICMFIDCVTCSTQTLILRFIVQNKIGEVIGEHIQRL